MRRAILMLALFGCGPSDPDPASVEPPRLDERALRLYVQPELERMCAQTACHGDPARQYLLYGRHATRIDPTWSAPQLEDREYAANLEATRGMLKTPDPLDAPFLQKPLRVEAGGSIHAGGDQFFDRSDPIYVLFACWAMGREGCRP